MDDPGRLLNVEQREYDFVRSITSSSCTASGVVSYHGEERWDEGERAIAFVLRSASFKFSFSRCDGVSVLNFAEGNERGTWTDSLMLRRTDSSIWSLINSVCNFSYAALYAFDWCSS